MRWFTLQQTSIANSNYIQGDCTFYITARPSAVAGNTCSNVHHQPVNVWKWRFITSKNFLSHINVLDIATIVVWSVGHWWSVPKLIHTDDESTGKFRGTDEQTNTCALQKGRRSRSLQKSFSSSPFANSGEELLPVFRFSAFEGPTWPSVSSATEFTGKLPHRR